MLLSVVIPVYNGERYLKMAIRSVLDQPSRDLEVICVNDGSTDGSETILRRMAEEDDRVRILIQKNLGVASARNKGIDAAKGKYVAFLDQDDIWISDVVDFELAALLDKSEFDLVSFSYYESNQEMTRGRLLPREKGERRALAQFAGENFRHHSSYFYRTAFLRGNDIGVDPYRNEDERFRMQCVYLADSALYLPNPLFVYRNNRLSVTHRKGNTSVTIQSCLQGFQLLCEKTNHKDIKAYCDGIILHLLLELAQALAREGEKKDEIRDCLNQYHVSERYRSAKWLSKKDSDDWRMYFNHLDRFRKSYMFRGVIGKILRAFLSVPPIAMLYERRKYPIELQL